jgi:hypothetical protein
MILLPHHTYKFSMNWQIRPNDWQISLDFHELLWEEAVLKQSGMLWNAQDPRQVAPRAAVAASPQAATVAAAAPAPSPEEDSAEEEEEDEEAPAPAPTSGPARPGSPAPAVGPSMDGATAPNNTATCSITLDSPPTTTVTCEPVLLKVGTLAAQRSRRMVHACSL